MQAVDFESGDLIESRTLKHSVGITGMEIEGVQPAGLGVSVQRDFIRLASAQLVDDDGERSRRGLFEGHLYFQFFGLGDLPSGVSDLAFLIPQANGAHTARIGGLKMQDVLASDDKSACVFGSDNPLFRSGSAQPETRTLEGTETPHAAQDTAKFSLHTKRRHSL